MSWIAGIASFLGTAADYEVSPMFGDTVLAVALCIFFGLFIGYLYAYHTENAGDLWMGIPIALVLSVIAVIGVVIYHVKECPNCGEKVTTSYCSYCGEAIKVDTTPTCPSCGAECDTPFCGNCGTKLNLES